MPYQVSNMVTAEYPSGRQNFNPSIPTNQNPSPVQAQTLLGLARLSPTLSRFKQSFTQAADTRVACLGDSTSAGAWSAGTPWVNARINSAPSVLGRLLLAAGLPISQDSVFGNAAGNFTFDPRMSASTNNWTVFSPTWLGAGCYRNDTNEASTLNFACELPFNTIDLYYLQAVGAASATIGVNGSAPLGATVNMAGGALFAVKVTRTFATPVTGTININRLVGAGACSVLGIVASNTLAKKIQVFNWGWGGSTAANWVDTSAANYSAFEGIAMLAPHLTFINLGINDAINASVPATYAANIATLITQCQLSGDVVGIIPSPIAVSQATQAAQNALYRLARSTFQEFGCPIVDFNALYGNQVNGAAAGYFAPGNDLVHPGPTGYEAEAALMMGVPGLLGDI